MPNPRLERFIRVGAEVLEQGVGLATNSHPIAWAAAGLSAAASLLCYAEKYGDPCWTADPLAIDAVVEVAGRAKAGDIVKQYSNGVAERMLNECRYGWNSEGWRCGPYGDGKPLARFCWESLGPSIDAYATAAEKGRRVALKSSEPFIAPNPTPGAKEVLRDAKDLRGMEPVGQLLWGAPRTGKTEAARWVAQSLGGFTIRARLSSVSPESIQGLVEILAPRSVILDDIDRGETSQALDLVEQITRQGVVVLATTNDKSKVDDALLDSRRLGLHYEFKGVDGATLSSLVDGLDVGDVRDELAGQPIGRVRDFVGHCRALGLERATELHRRVRT